MNIAVVLGHPAQVHLFKHLIWNLQKMGHNVYVFGRDKDVVIKLLEGYKIPYIKFGHRGSNIVKLAIEALGQEITLYKFAKKHNIDVFVGVVSPVTVHVAKLLRRRSVIFCDSEPEAIKYPISDIVALPFADRIVTLASVKHDYGSKAIRANSYKELAYLHPDVFTPNSSVLHEAGIPENEEYCIVRFVAWGAYHDIGEGGFSFGDKIKLIKILSEKMKVYISSESTLPEEFEKYRLPIPPEKMHDLLSFAKILVSDSQTMTTEAAVLGIPAVRCNSFVGENDMGNFEELENKFGLIFNYRNADDAIEKVRELILMPDLKEQWSVKKELLLSEKENLNNYLMDVVLKSDQEILNYIMTTDNNTYMSVQQRERERERES